jgi:hypothetical protein
MVMTLIFCLDTDILEEHAASDFRTHVHRHKFAPCDENLTCLPKWPFLPIFHTPENNIRSLERSGLFTIPFPTCDNKPVWPLLRASFVHFFPLVWTGFLSLPPLLLGPTTTFLVRCPYNQAYSWTHILQHWRRQQVPLKCQYPPT